MSSNVTPYVQCKCGHELSGFKILDRLGRFEPGSPPNPDQIEKILPRLKCDDCGRKGKGRLIFKPSVTGQSSLMVASAKSRRYLRPIGGLADNRAANSSR